MTFTSIATSFCASPDSSGEIKEGGDRLNESSSDDKTLQLRVDHERQFGVYGTLKKQLKDMNSTSGLFPEHQLKQFEDFTRRGNKKKVGEFNFMSCSFRC
ncbi:hypothetical protein PsorP6_004074 [Peronosclerospora sorghi]|uniref:Uncharacterized protein n=1 Tax=Peronosclerospora sorghi TaxID=230839 RepID=A0ACC0VPM4_9STRA|nr:hypothetical protein PsorP6_004074 [Peronosclerospora sorghi]